MPPKLVLNVHVDASLGGMPRDGDGGGGDGGQSALHAPSIEIGPSGTLKLYKSMAAYEFNGAGMTRAGPSAAPLAAGARAMQSSYRISEQDVRPTRVLGQGASGVVVKAFLPREARFVAVKKVSVLDRGTRHQLVNDIKALCAAPDVPGLVRFYGAYHAAGAGQVAVVLEYMDGGSLADLLAAVGGPLPEPLLAAVAARVLPALAHLHGRRCVHRDVKPANVLVSTAGDVKLSDFGISAFVDSTLAQCHTYLGTVTYMSPERIDGAAYSFPADVWALGLALLEAGLGRYPYDASGGTMALMLALMQDEPPLPPPGGGGGPDLSPELRDFVRACMAKDPARRPTAEALLRHPFVARAAPAAELRAFLRARLLDAGEKLGDAAAVASARLYNTLAAAPGDGAAVAAFYAADAAGAVEGERLRGRYTLAARLERLVRGAEAAAGGAVALTVEAVDHQVLAGAGAAGEGPQTLVVNAHVAVTAAAAAPGGAAPAVLGRLADCMTLVVHNADGGAPGVDFVVVQHVLRWTEPLRSGAGRRRGGDKPGGGGCKVQ